MEPRRNMETIIERDYIYGCWRVNGILFPEPLNFHYPAPPPPPPPQPPSQQIPPRVQQEQAGSSNEGSSQRKKRDLIASKIVESKAILLRLLRCAEESEYILEMLEIATGKTTYYVLLPYESLNRRKMKAKEIHLGQRVVFPVTEEIYPDIESKYPLSMKERLEGRWTIEVRERTGTTKTEKFYFHEKVNKTIRSMNDVATFIVYRVIY